LLDTFAASPFYVPFLLHNLLEGNGLPDDGKATCDALLDILNTKAVIMVRSQKKMAAKSEDATNEEADTLAICEKIVATSDKVTQAIKEGRESGVVVNPANETTSKGEIPFVWILCISCVLFSLLVHLTTILSTLYYRYGRKWTHPSHECLTRRGQV